MEGAIKEGTSLIRSTEMVHSCDPMAGSISGTGRKANSMGWALMFRVMVRTKRGIELRERE